MNRIYFLGIGIALFTTRLFCQVQTPVSEKYKDITADNFINRMLKEVKHYDKEPRYFIRPVQNNCVFEVLINDKRVYNDYGLEVTATPISINHAILKSGEQTLTVRMYPLGDLLKDNYDTGNTITTLLDNTSMKIEVVKYDAYNISHRLSDENTVLTHYSPTKEGSKKFIGAGLPYYEYTFSFNAEVPYHIEGWQNSQDLTAFDKEELEAQVKKYYKQVKEIYLTEDIDALAKISFGDYLIIAKSKYYNKQDIKEMLNSLEEEIHYKEKDFGNFASEKMSFYGRNKIVSLRHTSFDPIDERLRGESALWFKYNDEEYGLSGYFPSVDLHLPQGESLENLRMID